MMPDDPEQLRAFMRGETDDPGVVRAVRGGIRFPAVQAQRTVMPDGTLVVDGEVDGRRIVGAVAPSAAVDLSPPPPDPDCVVEGCGWGDGGTAAGKLAPMCGQGSWRYECRLNWASTDPEDREPYVEYLAARQ